MKIKSIISIMLVLIALVSFLFFLSEYLYIKHPWLTEKLYVLYKNRSIEYKVPFELALCVVQKESDGINKRSNKKNKNGTYDYGRFQINSVHMPNNPRLLLIDKINSQKGFWYLSLAIEKANYNTIDAIRLYNQGIHGKKKNYKNWEYVKEIFECYNQDTIRNNQ